MNPRQTSGLSTSASAGAARQSAGRIAVSPAAEPEDWMEIYDRLNRSAGRLSTLLVNGSAAAATFAGMLVTAVAAGFAILHFFPDAGAGHLAAVVILPAALAGAAAGQAGGNLFFRLWFRLDDSSRRGFATRLSLARAPAGWPAGVVRWLFTGDWLGSPVYDLRLPYVRVFLTGGSPSSCREEDGLWREVHGHLSGDGLWEAGTNIRVLSYLPELPDWARRVTAGDGFADLCNGIGAEAAEDWVGHLWRRATRQWPDLADTGDPSRAARECFEMHALTLADGRDALVVVLRPAAFVRSVADTDRAGDALAA